MTIKAALKNLQKRLTTVSDVPALEAERLLLRVLDREDSSWLTAHEDEILSPTEVVELERLVRERSTGKPLAYVLGEWDFYGRTFAVNESVLVPRPETEELVTRALQWLKAQEERVTVADVGCGSSVIAITLVLEMRDLGREVRMLATDISAAALKVAQDNARRHGVEADITFLQGDMLEPLQGRQVDLIVSNPPYVPTAEVIEAENSKETVGLTFEPAVALDGGEDGQNYINILKSAGVPVFLETIGGEIIES